MSSVIEFLLREAYLEYAVRTKLLHENPQSKLCNKAKEKAANHPLTLHLFDSLKDWETSVVSNHKNPSLLYNNLLFLADLGFTLDHPAIARTVSDIFKHTDENGVPRVLINVPKHFGGTGMDDWGWALCDAPAVLLALLRLGAEEEKLYQPIASLASLIRENGWPCVCSKELGKFRGPGKKGDPCPYATLQMLKLLLSTNRWKNSPEAKTGADTILTLWENSLMQHPYIFYMGTDFRKLKAPPVWYDIVSVADALSQCSFIKTEAGFQQMISIIREKADCNGLYTPESVYTSMKNWDFGQKKTHSAYLTFCILRIIDRITS